MEGWIKLHRSLINWQWYDDANTLKVFLHLLLTANYEDRQWHGIEVKRGQRLISVREFANEVKLSYQTVRTSLSRLISTQELTQEVTQRLTLITICNYDSYQVLENNSNATDNATLTQDQRNLKEKEKVIQKEIRKEEELLKENTTLMGSTKEKVFSFATALKNAGCSYEIIQDFLAIRSKKKAVNSERAFMLIETEAEKAGISVAEAVEFAVRRCWRGFEASWYFNEQRKQYGERVNTTAKRCFTSAEADFIVSASKQIDL